MRDIIDVILDHPSYAEKVAAFQITFRKSLEHNFGTVLEHSTAREQLLGLCHTVRELLMNRWIATQGTYFRSNGKRLYYLSMEYLLGRLVKNALINLDLLEVGREAMQGMGLDLDAIADLEVDPGLGNGGLGRLAACYLDSLSTLNLPAYGYGIRFEFGMFRQVIEKGAQKEVPDPWLRFGHPIEIEKNIHAYEIGFGGSSVFHENVQGHIFAAWEPEYRVLAVPHDLPVPGYGTHNVNSLRLWAAKADEEFHFNIFDAGDYVGAVMDKVQSEVLSKVLYPNDSNELGKLLRLKQQYFLVSASLQDILRRFKNSNDSILDLPNKVVIQLNDTHPTLAIPELMRLLIDEESLSWEEAYAITQQTIAFTNHTVMPEALECWPGSMFRQTLPRHYQIIEEMNRRFMRTLKDKPIYDRNFMDRVSILGQGPNPEVRMANLAVATSFSVNGVAALHTTLLKEKVFPEFNRIFPNKFHNKTNGISPRRWLRLANPELSALITDSLGHENWVTDLEQLQGLEKFVDDQNFLDRLSLIKRHNKERLATLIHQELGEKVDPNSMYDVLVKRIHEYKRQLLKILHCLHLYHELRINYDKQQQPRTVVFAGKAAPGYKMAKLIIQFIHAAAAMINRDPLTRDRLKVVFLPNYNVSLAERIIPAANLSEQISTAGTEASGTGNMKFCLNGALILGTLDGANIEIRDHVGQDNIFIFGHTVNELRTLQGQGYRPQEYYQKHENIRRILDEIQRGYFYRSDRERFKPIWDTLMTWGDHYYHLADFPDYVRCNEEVDRVYGDQKAWQQKSLMNIARIGWFSSDRAVQEYTRDVWHLHPCPLEHQEGEDRFGF
jgi:starch phosphorylase